MVKQTARRTRVSRYHILLVSVFAIIIFLAVLAFVIQRNTYLDALAGEAIRQSIPEKKQLVLTDEALKISQAVQQGKETVFIECPAQLTPKDEQHWSLQNWKVWPWRVVNVQCSGGSRIICYYADDSGDLHRADQIIFYKDFENLDNCSPFGVTKGCNCAIKNPETLTYSY